MITDRGRPNLMMSFWGTITFVRRSYVFSIPLPNRYRFYFNWEGPFHKRGTTSNLLSKMCLFNSVVFLKQPLSTVWKNHCFEVGSENDCFLLLWALDFKTFCGFTSKIVTVCMCSTHQPGQGLFLFFALLLSYWEWRWGMIFTQKWHGGKGTMSGDNVDREPSKGSRFITCFKHFLWTNNHSELDLVHGACLAFRMST